MNGMGQWEQDGFGAAGGAGFRPVRGQTRPAEGDAMSAMASQISQAFSPVQQLASGRRVFVEVDEVVVIFVSDARMLPLVGRYLDGSLQG